MNTSCQFGKSEFPIFHGKSAESAIFVLNLLQLSSKKLSKSVMITVYGFATLLENGYKEVYLRFGVVKGSLKVKVVPTPF